MGVWGWRINLPAEGRPSSEVPTHTTDRHKHTYTHTSTKAVQGTVTGHWIQSWQGIGPCSGSRLCSQSSCPPSPLHRVSQGAAWLSRRCFYFKTLWKLGHHTAAQSSKRLGRIQLTQGSLPTHSPTREEGKAYAGSQHFRV